MIAVEWAEKISADKNNLIGIPYATLDCQAFVEYCLRKYANIKKDWRGSNDMWRNAVHDKSDNFDNVDVTEKNIIPSNMMETSQSAIPME